MFTSDEIIWYFLPVVLTAIIGGVFVNKKEYKTIQENTPFWTPPPLVFGIIWSIIYFIFLYVFTYLGDNYYYLFLITLLLNASWTLIFFKLKQKLISFIMIILMMVLALFTIAKLQEKADSDTENSQSIKTTMYFFYIYPIWLIFAASLTICSVFSDKKLLL